MSAESWIARAAWQPLIFGERPRRSDLLALQPGWPLRSFHLSVLRNQPFEFIASVLRPFLAYAGLEARITYSDYDDSLAALPDEGADLAFLWLDFARYQMSVPELLGWIEDRVKRIRQTSSCPLLISDWPASTPQATQLNRALRELAATLPGVYVTDQAVIARTIGAGYLDRRVRQISGTTLSDVAYIETARHLGLVWFPAALGAAIKGVAVDFDGTLYDGVLGEDGPDGITITLAHQEFQRRLRELRDRGFFLAGVSRNLSADIEELFTARHDMVLRRDDFSSLVAGWEAKADGVRRVADALRIGPDALLFIDDNPGELAAVAAAWPGIRCLHASDPSLTAAAIATYPGLMRLRSTEADRHRVKDLAAAAGRDEAQRQSVDPDAYLRSLEVELGFAVDARADQQRLHELSNKTNQFNTALLRLSEVDVARYLSDPARHAISISLRDRLSDSGIIGAVFTRLEGRRLWVDEVDISCRALGRQLERVMIMEAVRRAIGTNPVTDVAFAFRPGPRNAPARAFLDGIGRPLDGVDGWVSMTWELAAVQQLVASAPVRVRDDQVLPRAA